METKFKKKDSHFEESIFTVFYIEYWNRLDYRYIYKIVHFVSSSSICWKLAKRIDKEVEMGRGACTIQDVQDCTHQLEMS